ncbi:MAG: hypothetical protein RLZZ502_1203 [Pseudomonadota bacterium]|jgi:uncharacterized membrane protein
MSRLDVFSPLDWVALALFFLAWFGYHFFSLAKSKQQVSLLNALIPYRKQWLSNTVTRENRILDSQLLGNLIQSATFFSSTTILIMGGLLALTSAGEKNLDLVGNIPFAAKVSAQATELKIILLVLIFMFAFVKFSWSLRQYNFVSILIGALPERDAGDEQNLATRAANILHLAGENFTQGLRSYYFALPALLWVVHPLLFVLSTLTLVMTLYWMEFHSSTLAALKAPQD